MLNQKRTIVLDTETTGINSVKLPHINHRVIEIGAVEIINRRFTGNNFHVYLKPDRKIDSSASQIHGITDKFLLNKPSFQDISEDFFKYIRNSELIIHNASFDLGFLEQEFHIINSNRKNISNYCNIIDTLKMARNLFPGKKNTLDALCMRYKIKNSSREKHSAILDAYLLGKLYLVMTGGQESILFSYKKNNNTLIKSFNKKNAPLKILQANPQEIHLHNKYIQYMNKNSKCLWN